MTKKKAWISLAMLAVLLLVTTYIDIFGLGAAGAGSADKIKLGLDLAGGVSITYQVVGQEEPDPTDMADTISKLQKRVLSYSTESSVYQEGANRINIEIPGVSDANAILQDLGRPGALYFLSQTGAQGELNYMPTATEDGYTYTLLRDISALLEDGSVALTGTDIAEARAGTYQNSMGNTETVVDLQMTAEGKAKFAAATARAYGDGSNPQTIAIYYDGVFVSVPRVNGVIEEGQAQITGMATYEEAENLASTIRIGGLKLELEELHSKVVGAHLGVEAISSSLKAGAIGFAIVALFMIAVYKLAGLASVGALAIYVSSIVMLLGGFDLTLTLPGIAGIILSVGMAVDANVIVFARIREELAAGKTVAEAMKEGFDKALSAILDGNITTVLAAAVLWILGPGTIKGFAQTLILGIALSMFTALFVTRWILQALYALGLREEKYYGRAKERQAIDFLSKGRMFAVLSLLVILAGGAGMAYYQQSGKGALNYSLEFRGGTATTVVMGRAMSLEEANAQLLPVAEQAVGGAVQIQTVQDSTEIILKTAALPVEKREALALALVEAFGLSEEDISTETISSTISGEMKRDTLLAVAVAIAAMLLYVKLRFKDIRFGISSVAALLHDVLVVLSFYALARVSVGNTFIACMLTIVGYSINATIVIFDRVRENAGEKDIRLMVNNSITQTLSRSLFTSLTTFVMVAVLYVLGVTAIKDFALPLMVGIVCGAYSSVCLAGYFWFVLQKKKGGRA